MEYQRTENKYGLTFSKIQKLKVMDRGKVKNPIFQKEGKYWEIRKNVGTREDFICGAEGSFEIRIYEEDAPEHEGGFWSQLMVYEGLSRYEFEEFYVSGGHVELESEFLAAINDLIDIGVLGSDEEDIIPQDCRNPETEKEYAYAGWLEKKGEFYQSMQVYRTLADYRDSAAKTREMWRHIIKYNMPALSAGHWTAGIKPDGTVAVVGGEKQLEKEDRNAVKKWEEIDAVSCGYLHMAGLQMDGTVVAAGDDSKYQCEVSRMKNKSTVACGAFITAGLNPDGYIWANGEVGVHGIRDGIAEWEGAYDAVAVGIEHVAALRRDGRVAAAGTDLDGRCSGVSDWENMVAIGCGGFHTVGLKADGTVLAAGDNKSGQCEVSDWKDIVAVACGFRHTVGLKTDGTVVAAGSRYGDYEQDVITNQCEVSDWKDIVAIACGFSHTVGLKADGTVAAAGDNRDGACNVEKLGKLRVLLSEADRWDFEHAMKNVRKKKELLAERDKLGKQLKEIKLFDHERRKELQKKMEELDRRLQYY